MDLRPAWSACGAVVASLVLTSCGGELLAAVAFIGSAGGDWREDADSVQPGLQQRSACGTANGIGVAGTDPCVVNIQPANPPANLYATSFDVTFTGNLPGCPQNSTVGGRIEGNRISLPNCFAGAYVTVNEAVRDGSPRHMFFDFVPDLSQGVWVELQEGQRRFKFSSNSAGCEFSAPTRPAVTVALIGSNVAQPAGPFETTIGSLTIAGDIGGAWSGRFIGVSAMSLKRGSQVLELQRRNESPSPPCL